jgi:Transposase DNA-binding
MVEIFHQDDPQQWAEEHFAAVPLSDVRRRKRVVRIAEAMAATPGRSIPQLFPTLYDVKAAYTLLHHPEATPDTLQTSHREEVKTALQHPGEYLLVEDTTTMVWSGKRPIPGLGPVANGGDWQQGFHLHTVLAVRWPQGELSAEARRPVVELLGVCDQHYRVRPSHPLHARRTHSLHRHKRARESQVWEQAGQRIGLAPSTPAVRWVRVCDRGADIYEHLQTCRALGHGFVVRAAQDRTLFEPLTSQKRGRLFATARAVVPVGEFVLELRSRPQQAARRAQLQVGATRVWLCAPQRPGRKQGSNPPLECTVLRVWESTRPRGVSPWNGCC